MAGKEERGEKRQFSAAQKVKIIKEALLTDLGVSGVCRKYEIPTSLFYKWQERFFEGAREGLERANRGSNASKEQRVIEGQQKELDRMKSVIAEITAENIELKKTLGE